MKSIKNIQKVLFTLSATALLAIPSVVSAGSMNETQTINVEETYNLLLLDSEHIEDEDIQRTATKLIEESTVNERQIIHSKLTEKEELNKEEKALLDATNKVFQRESRVGKATLGVMSTAGVLSVIYVLKEKSAWKKKREDK